MTSVAPRPRWQHPAIVASAGVVFAIASVALYATGSGEEGDCEPGAAECVPEEVGDCAGADVEDAFGLKLEAAPLGPSGPHELGGYSVTILVRDTLFGQTFDWQGASGVEAVIVNGGPASNLYVYDPLRGVDTGLHAPVNPKSGKHRDISHMVFCFAAAASPAPVEGPTGSPARTPAASPRRTPAVVPVIVSPAPTPEVEAGGRNLSRTGAIVLGIVAVALLLVAVWIRVTDARLLRVDS